MPDVLNTCPLPWQVLIKALQASINIDASLLKNCQLVQVGLLKCYVTAGPYCLSSVRDEHSVLASWRVNFKARHKSTGAVHGSALISQAAASWDAFLIIAHVCVLDRLGGCKAARTP